MLSTVFSSILTQGEGSVSATSFILCIVVSLAIGLVLALMYGFKNRTTNSFLVTLASLPAIVCAVIMMVNGNIGAGVAVAGAFALVRFRSVPGSAKEISAIFLAMATGLMTGMGYLAYAVVFALVLGFFMTLLSGFDLNLNKDNGAKILRITIPEDLEFNQAFDEVFDKYTDSVKQVSVKTTNMGSMYKLRYEVKLKKSTNEKDFLDDLRCRNGNLEIALSNMEVTYNEL